MYRLLRKKNFLKCCIVKITKKKVSNCKKYLYILGERCGIIRHYDSNFMCDIS